MAPVVETVETVALYESPLSQSSEVFVSCLLVATAFLFVFSLVLLYRQAGLSQVYASMSQTQQRSLLALDEAARELRALDTDLSARIETMVSRSRSTGIAGVSGVSGASSVSSVPSASAQAQQLSELQGLQRFARDRIARVESGLVPRALIEKPASSTAF